MGVSTSVRLALFSAQKKGGGKDNWSVAHFNLAGGNYFNLKKIIVWKVKHVLYISVNYAQTANDRKFPITYKY